MMDLEAVMSRRAFLAGAAAACAFPAWGHPGHAEAPEYVEFGSPPLLLPSRADVAWHREQAAGRAEVGALVDTLRAAVRMRGGEGPAPLEELIYEGRVSNDPERVHTVAHLQDMWHLFRLAWLQALEPDEALGRELDGFVSAWARVCLPTGNAVNDDKMSPILAAYALHGDRFGPELTETVRAWTARMVDARYKWALMPGRANGHARHIALSLASCRLLGREEPLEPLVDAARRLMAAGLRPDGTSYDLEYRDALHYHCSFVKSLLKIAALCRPLGVDLWAEQTDDGSSIRKSVDYVTPFATGEKQRGEWTHSEIDLDRERKESGDPAYQPGVLWDPRASAELYRLASSFDPTYHAVLERLPDGVGRCASWVHWVDTHITGAPV